MRVSLYFTVIYLDLAANSSIIALNNAVIKHVDV